MLRKCSHHFCALQRLTCISVSKFTLTTPYPIASLNWQGLVQDYMRSRGREPLAYYFQNLRETRRKPASKSASVISVDELSKIVERMIATQETRFRFDDVVTVAKHHFDNCLIYHSHISQTREHIPLKKDRTYRIRGADLLSDVLLVLRE